MLTLALVATLSLFLALLVGLALRAVRVARETDTAPVIDLAWVVLSMSLVTAAFVVLALVQLLLEWAVPSTAEVLVEVVVGAAATSMVSLAWRRLYRLRVDLERNHRLLAVLVDYGPAGAPDHTVLEAVNLTAREREVIDLIAAGFSSDGEIAERLFIAPATAATHVRNILRKTGFRSRRQLLVLATRSHALHGS